jgi:small subunit ribosomal protein S5
MDKDNQKRNIRGRGRRGRRSSFDRPKPEFEQKIVGIRRVTRVVKGGRRFSFSVALIAGDKKGNVGLGQGKASDTALAIQKAFRDAKKNMVKLNLTEEFSVPYELSAKFSGSSVKIMPNKGRGIVAGTVLRDILKLAGVKDVTGKILSRTKNKLNNSKAVMKAFEPISSKYVKKVKKDDKKLNPEKKETPVKNKEDK